jgi:hypothetical protein
MIRKASRGRVDRRSAVVISGIVLGTFLLMAVATAGSAYSERPTKGRIPDAAWRADGTLDDQLVPDFIAVWGRDGESTVGYVEKDAVLPPSEPRRVPESDRNSEPSIPVYGEDLQTVVGFMVPDKGFVPLGTDPDSIPKIPGYAFEQPTDD